MAKSGTCLFYPINPKSVMSVRTDKMMPKFGPKIWMPNLLKRMPMLCSDASRPSDFSLCDLVSFGRG